MPSGLTGMAARVVMEPSGTWGPMYGLSELGQVSVRGHIRGRGACLPKIHAARDDAHPAGEGLTVDGIVYGPPVQGAPIVCLSTADGIVSCPAPTIKVACRPDDGSKVGQEMGRLLRECSC